MPARAVWRPPWYLWALLGLAGLASLYKLAPGRLEGHWSVITPLVVFAGVLVLRKLWELPPAVTACAAVALTVFSGGWAQMGLGGLPLDRLLILVVVLQVFLRAPGVAHSPRLQIRNVHLLMGLTAIYVLASALAAGTLTNELGFLSIVDEIGVAPYLMFLLAPAVFAGRRERDMLLATLVGLGAYLGLTAVFAAFGPHSLVFPHYIVQAHSEVSEPRAYGPFQSTVAEGFSTFACAVAAVMAFARWRGRYQRYAAAAVAGICVLGCFLTLERGVWIAAIAAILLVALATHTGRRRLLPGALACAVAIGGALAISPALAHQTSSRVGDQVSVWARQNQTAAGLRMLNARPLFGFGWDSYTSNSREYFRQAPDYPLNGYSVSAGPGQAEDRLPLHDTYLSYAVELGLVGALLWLVTLFWGIGEAIFSRGSAALRPWKLGLLAIAVFFVVVAAFNPYQQSFPAMLLWVWAGVALGCVPSPVRERAGLAVDSVNGAAWAAT